MGVNTMRHNAWDSSKPKKDKSPERKILPCLKWGKYTLKIYICTCFSTIAGLMRKSYKQK